MNKSLLLVVLIAFSWFATHAQKPANKTEPKKPAETKKTTPTPKPTTPADNKNTKPSNAKPNTGKPSSPANPKPEPVVKQEPAPMPQQGINLERFTMDLALEAGVPVGFLAYSSIVTAGLSYHLNYHFSKKFSLGVCLGEQFLFPKKKGHATTYYLNAFAEASYSIVPKLHIDGGVGYASYYGTASASAFFPGGRDFKISGVGGCLGFGYRLSRTLDAAARFQMSKSVSLICLRLSWCFAGANNYN